MATSGRVEVNLCRLLNRCEAMASGSDCQDWRLEKVVRNVFLVILFAINLELMYYADVFVYY